MRERAPSGWNFENMESLLDWAKELKGIPSSTVAKYCKLLSQCQACLNSLSEKSPEHDAEVTPRKSSRIQKKTSPEVPDASTPTTGPLKTGDTYTNAVKVHVPFLAC